MILCPFIFGTFPSQCVCQGFGFKLRNDGRVGPDSKGGIRIFNLSPFIPGASAHGKCFPRIFIENKWRIFIFEVFKGHGDNLGESDCFGRTQIFLMPLLKAPLTQSRAKAHKPRRLQKSYNPAIPTKQGVRRKSHNPLFSFGA